jgi:hypothetical protein
LFDGVQRHFQQNFSYIVAVSFIDGGFINGLVFDLVANTCGNLITQLISIV